MDASTPFKWLDLLEQEFDRNYAFVDVLLDDAEFEDSYSDGNTLAQVRQRLSYISGAFGQLVHKALTIFQTNLKLEARVLSAEEETARTEARCKTLSDEVKSLRAQLAAVSSSSSSRQDLPISKHQSILVEQNEIVHPEPDPEIVKLLEEDAQRRMLTAFRAQLAIAQHTRLMQGSQEMRQEVLQLRSEAEALRLTLRYLDKERAGRIQQIQLLSNSKMPVDERNRVWTQLETEIALQRCKTVVQTCLIRQQNKLSQHEPEKHHHLPFLNSQMNEPAVGEVRTLQYTRPSENGALGLSIVGGRDVALPIIVSSVDSDSPLCGQVFVGDLVKIANGVDLSVATRQEAVDAIVAPAHKKPEEPLEIVVCYLGGPDDSNCDDELIANGSLNSSQNMSSGANNNSNTVASNNPGDGMLDSSGESGVAQYETVWLQNGELWPNLSSGLSNSEGAINTHQVRLGMPQNGLTEPAVIEEMLQASVSTTTSIFASPSFNASASRVNSGALVTLKTGIQPRECDVDMTTESLLASSSAAADLNASDSASHSDYSTTMGDIAFAADV